MSRSDARRTKAKLAALGETAMARRLQWCSGMKTNAAAKFSTMSGTEQETAVLRFFARCGRGGTNPQWKVVARQGAANSFAQARLDRATAATAARIGMLDVAKESLSDAVEAELFAAEVVMACDYLAI